MKKIITLLTLLFLTSNTFSQPFQAVTEEWAPFNYTDNGVAKGLGVEMVQAILKDAGYLNTPINFLAWNRAYNTALTQANVLIFTMGRTVERESLFNWLFKIADREIWLVKLKSTTINITSLEDAKNYTIGTGPKEDATTQELVAKGFTKLDMATTNNPEETSILKLFSGRNTFIVGNLFTLAHTSKLLGLDFNQVVPVILVTSSAAGYWAALSKTTDIKISETLKSSARKLEENGTFPRLRSNYVH